MVMQVIWSSSAQKQLMECYEYILLDSYQNAEKVKNGILSSTGKLTSHPEAHPLDRYKKENDGSFRAYEIHRYRIAYRVTKQNIIITRIRHTSMEPLLY